MKMAFQNMNTWEELRQAGMKIQIRTFGPLTDHPIDMELEYSGTKP